MWIGRNPDTTIYGLWANKQWEGQEELPDTHPDVLAFRNRVRPDRRTTIESKIDSATTLANLKTILKELLIP